MLPTARRWTLPSLPLCCCCTCPQAAAPVKWWQRKIGRATYFQIAVGLNITLVAIGLPMVWNSTVRRKWEAYHASKPPPQALFATLEQQEQWAAEVSARLAAGTRALAFCSTHCPALHTAFCVPAHASPRPRR